MLSLIQRAERLARGEEEDIGESNRITMAQAALLNLRGAELQMQNAAFRQHVIPTHSTPESQRPSQVRNNMQGLRIMGPQGAIPNYGTAGKSNGFEQGVNVTSSGQGGHHTRKAMTQQMPFQEPTSFLHGGLAVRDHRHRRASFSSSESFVTNPDARLADFIDHTNSFSSCHGGDPRSRRTSCGASAANAYTTVATHAAALGIGQWRVAFAISLPPRSCVTRD